MFTEFSPETGVKMRKQVNTPVSLTWEGWQGEYQARALEMGTHDLLVEIRDLDELDRITLLETRPVVGLLFPAHDQQPIAQSLVARVTQAREVAPTRQDSARLLLELSFPEDLTLQQQRKVSTVLRGLG